MNRPAKDDPRLSKGLQLLQNKIAVLEDLSDRTETQVSQLTALLEQKVKVIQLSVQAADKQINKIEQSMQKSLEVAKIFQDRIPHSEILERQSTIKYVKAARLAHQGLSVEEIANQVDLSRGEIEFIAKVNREQLMFCEESLPEWAQERSAEAEDKSEFSDVDNIAFMPPLLKDMGKDLSSVFEVQKNDQKALKKLGEAFSFKSINLKKEEWREKLKSFLSSPGPSLCNIFLDLHQEFEPRLKSKMVDGVISTPELDDMHPFLDSDELASVRASALKIN
jgi:hypothetical protein